MHAAHARRGPDPRRRGRGCSSPHRWRPARRAPCPGCTETRDAEERLRRPVAHVEVAHLEDGLAHDARGLRPLRSTVDRPWGLAVAQVGGPHGGVVADLLGRPDGDPLAEVEHEHRVGQREHGGDVVLDDDERERLVGLVDDLRGTRRAGSPTPSCRDPRAARRAAAPGGRWPGRGPTSTRRSDAERQRGHRGLGHPGQPQQLEEPVDALVLRRRGRKQGRGDRTCPATAGPRETRAR